MYLPQTGASKKMGGGNLILQSDNVFKKSTPEEQGNFYHVPGDPMVLT